MSLLRIFGLSIDEKVHWATAMTERPREDKDGALVLGDLRQIQTGTFEHIRVAGPLRPGFDLQAELAAALSALDIQDCAAVGVATIGVVERRKKLLKSIALANLLPRDRTSLVDFRRLFGETLGVRSVAEKEDRLSVQNDATAIAFAEYLYLRRDDPAEPAPHLRHGDPAVGPMLYLRFDEGVNAGIIAGHQALISQLNIEAGHVCPPLHERDRDFRGVCPLAHQCYEGLASNARLRHSWPDVNPRPDLTLSDFPADHEAWEILAYYIARMSLSGALFVAPARIILGGSVVFGHHDEDGSRNRVYERLFPHIWAQFERLHPSYPPYGGGAVENFIEPGRITNDAGVFGALHLAVAALADSNIPVDIIRPPEATVH